MTRWIRASLPLVWIVLCAGCGAETAPTTTGHNAANANGGPSGAAGAFGVGAPDPGVDAGAAVGGQPSVPGFVGGSSGGSTGVMSIGGSSGTASSGPPPKSQAALVTTIAGQVCPWGMAIDATSVYWTTCEDPNFGSVLKVPKAGGPTTTLAVGERLSGIAVDHSSVYWFAARITGGSGGLMKISKDGGTPTTLTSYAGPAHLAVDGSEVYWIEQTPGAVMKMPVSGSDPVKLASASSAFQIALGDKDVFWLGQGVMKVPKAGGTAVTLTSSMFPTLPNEGLAVSATSVYFTSGSPAGTSGVSEVPAGGGVTDVVYGSSQPSAGGGPIAVDATRAYWADESNTVRAVPLRGGAATTLAIDQYNVVAIAVDATAVYWLANGNANNGEGTLVMLPLSAIDNGAQ